MSIGTAADAESTAGRWRRSTIGFGVAALLLALALLLSVAFNGSWITQSEDSDLPGDSSAEPGFARDMQVHHAQAVEIALVVRDRTDDPVIRTIAYDIATAQQQQMGQMYAWLELWGLSQTGRRSPMTWMSTGMNESASAKDSMAADMMLQPDGRMPGMATDDELAQLRSLEGRAAEKLFLSLMIRHHEGGVVMAESVLALSEVPVVMDLAESMAAAQASEIEQMKRLLEDRRGPVPE